MVEYMGKWPSKHRKTCKSGHRTAAKAILFPQLWYGGYDFHKPGGYLGNAGINLMMAFVHRPASGLEDRGANAVAEAYLGILPRKPDGIEVDVRVTADGVPLVVHSPLVRGSKKFPHAVRSLHYHRLPSNSFLTLREFLQLFSNYDGRLYVEIKDYRQGAVESVLAELNSFEGSLWFIALPWRAEALRWIKQAWPSARINIIVVNPMQSYIATATKLHADAITLGWVGVNTFRLVSSITRSVKSSIIEAQNNGIEVSAGLATSIRDLDWTSRLGIDAVWVDPPILDTVLSSPYRTASSAQSKS